MVRPSTSNGQIPVRQEIGPWKGAPRSSLPRAACRTPSPGRGGGRALVEQVAVAAACEAGAPPPDADGGDLMSRLEVADAIPTRAADPHSTARSALEAGRRDSLDQEALESHEETDDGQKGKQRHRKGLRPRAQAGGVYERAEGDRHCVGADAVAKV